MILTDAVTIPDKKDSIRILEANIDDSTPEELGLAMEKIFAAGAVDVNFIPCQMKKNRPGILLKAIVSEMEKCASDYKKLMELSAEAETVKAECERLFDKWTELTI